MPLTVKAVIYFMSYLYRKNGIFIENANEHLQRTNKNCEKRHKNIYVLVETDKSIYFKIIDHKEHLMRIISKINSNLCLIKRFATLGKVKIVATISMATASLTHMIQECNL